MAENGWYPDPGGSKGRFRYWDGNAWSETTTADPMRTPPPKAASEPAKRSGNKGWIVALVVLAIITAIVMAAFLWGTGGGVVGGSAKEDTNSSTPTVSAWDETSSPTPPPPPNNSGGQLVACPITRQIGSTTQPPGKLAADTLSVSTISGWIQGDMYLVSVYDSHSQIDEVYPGWVSNIAVGLLSNEDGFIEIAASAEQLMECFASSGYYPSFTGREDLIAGEQIDI